MGQLTNAMKEVSGKINEKMSKYFPLKKEKLTLCGKFDISNLNKKELKYFRIIYANSGTLFLTSGPGLAKSAILKNIAENIIYTPTGKCLNYLDIRLSIRDETDVGLYPNKVKIDEKYINEKGEEKIKQSFYLNHITPYWAKIANDQPTLIHLEELNRAPLVVRNAALQLLNERGIDFEFKFNDNVFIACSGNLGDADGSDVEEFDSALNGRLVHIKHIMTLDEWLEYYGYKNIQKSIVDFLIAHPDCYYINATEKSENVKAYASPRSWTYLSDYITKNYGVNADIEDWIYDITEIGNGYIGSVNSKFVRYLNDVLKISVSDIINKFNILLEEKITLTRSIKSELLFELKRMDLTSLNPNQLENVKLFLLTISEDEAVSFLMKLYEDDIIEEITTHKNSENQVVLSFLKDSRFELITSKMLNYIDMGFEKGKNKEEVANDDDFFKD